MKNLDIADFVISDPSGLEIIVKAFTFGSNVSHSLLYFYLILYRDR
jgi:hypothetical protein